MMFESFPAGAALVFGSTGGIGAAFMRALRENGHFVPVIEASRRSQPAFDLTDEASIAALVQHAAAQAPLRLVIDATGFLHDEQQGPEKSLRDLDATKLVKASLPLCQRVSAVLATIISAAGMAIVPRKLRSIS